MLTKHCYLNYCNVCTYMMATQHTTYRVLVTYWQFYIVQSWVTVLYMHVDTHLLGPHPFRLYSAVGFYARVCFGRHCIIQDEFSQRNKFALFQTLHMKWDFINIFYITLFQICVKYDCTVNWKKKNILHCIRSLYIMKTCYINIILFETRFIYNFWHSMVCQNMLTFSFWHYNLEVPFTIFIAQIKCSVSLHEIFHYRWI